MTAEQCLKEGNEGYNVRTIIDNLTDEQILDCMRDFAKFHVEKALQGASQCDLECYCDSWERCHTEFPKEDVLNSYPLSNII